LGGFDGEVAVLNNGGNSLHLFKLAQNLFKFEGKKGKEKGERRLVGELRKGRGEKREREGGREGGRARCNKENISKENKKGEEGSKEKIRWEENKREKGGIKKKKRIRKE